MSFNKNTKQFNNKKQLRSLFSVGLWLLFSLVFITTSYAQKADEDSTSTTMHYDNASVAPSNNKPIAKDAFEWQFILDLSVVYDPKIIAGIEQDEILHYLMPGLLVDISYKGFFLQSNQRRSNALLGGTEFGYQLLIQDTWEIDLIAKAYMQGYDSESLIKWGAGDNELLKGLKERESALGIALRYSHFFEDALFTLDFAYATPGIDEHNTIIGGLIVDSFYSYLIPYRNWDIYVGAGLTYFSQNISNYYIGVSPDEVTELRGEYTAEDGFRTQLEIYAQHPISQSWSFNTGITHSIFSNEVTESPLVDTNYTTQVMIGVQYVF